MSLILRLFGTSDPEQVCPHTGDTFVLNTIGGDVFCSECNDKLSVTKRFLRRPVVRHAD